MLLRYWRQAKSSTRWVGLDLGSASIKLAELEQTGAGFRLVNQVLQDLPSAPAPDPKDRLGWLQAVIREGGASEVHLAIGGPEVIIRCVSVPPMSVEELAEAVQWQVKDELPFPLQEAVLDFEVLGEVWEKDIKKLDVLVAAAPLRFVQEQIALVEQAGARVASVVPTVLALRRALQALVPGRLQGSVALMELGAWRTHVMVMKDGHPRFTRDVPMGGTDLTQALAGVMASERGEQLDLAKAEQLKRHYGVLAGNVEGATDEGIPLAQLAALMRVVLEKLLTEATRLFDFYKVQMGESGIERLLVAGGGASLKHLQSFLGEGLGLPVELVNPLKFLTWASSTTAEASFLDEGPRLTAAIGAALMHGQSPNLVPAELKVRRRQAAARRRLKTMAVAAGSVAIGVYGVLQALAFGSGAAFQRVQRDWQTVEPAYHHYLQMAQETQRLEGAMAMVRGFTERQPLWDGIFKELTQLAPSSVTLTSLMASASSPSASAVMQLTLQGTLATGGAATEGDLARFLDALEASVFFRDVHLRSSRVQVGAGQATTFDIECQLE
ncbi:MAG: type IV pilus assembly protein PilM [Candidatus Omnitrophica bacterium]|nr:type IV pilus assembly protein PilM [Candidatus Omnitrophota bacterium]